MKITKESIIGDVLDMDRGTAEFFLETMVRPETLVTSTQETWLELTWQPVIVLRG